VDNADTLNFAGLRVLVVDDDVDNCEVLAAILEHNGASVSTAQTAAHALKFFQREHPHVLISDIGLPDEDGFALLRRVRSLPPSRGGNIPAIALTGYERGDTRDSEDGCDFQDRLIKPVGVGQLLDAVSRLCANLPTETSHNAPA
jgi:CheY-like chemotaxis protein